MSGKTQSGVALYAFLEKEGVLNSGNDALIKAAKKRYYAAYKKEWKQRKRKEQKSFTVFFTPSEAGSIKKKASQCHTSATAFIKKSALAAANMLVVFDPVKVGEIHRLLVLYYTNLEQIIEEHQLSKSNSKKLLNEFTVVESEILRLCKG